MFSAAGVLRQARAASGLGVRELAASVDRPPSTITRIEQGQADPSVALLVELLEVCGYELTVTPTWAVSARKEQQMPSATSPEPPNRYPNPRNDDPWDNDAVQWLLQQAGGNRWTRGVLFEHLRRQRRLVERDAPRLAEAAEFARRHGVLQVEMFDHDLGKQIVHLLRTDGAAPQYPSDRVAAERR